MRYIFTACALSLAIASSACGQTTPDDPAEHISGSDEGTVACKTEETMIALLHASPPSGPTNEKAFDAFIRRGDCLIMPKGWLILRQEDPPINQQSDHASKWTIRTPNGIVHMWGAPMGGD